MLIIRSKNKIKNTLKDVFKNYWVVISLISCILLLLIPLVFYIVSFTYVKWGGCLYTIYTILYTILYIVCLLIINFIIILWKVFVEAYFGGNYDILLVELSTILCCLGDCVISLAKLYVQVIKLLPHYALDVYKCIGNYLFMCKALSINLINEFGTWYNSIINAGNLSSSPEVKNELLNNSKKHLIVINQMEYLIVTNQIKCLILINQIKYLIVTNQMEYLIVINQMKYLIVIN